MHASAGDAAFRQPRLMTVLVSEPHPFPYIEEEQARPRQRKSVRVVEQHNYSLEAPGIVIVILPIRLLAHVNILNAVEINRDESRVVRLAGRCSLRSTEPEARVLEQRALVGSPFEVVVIF